MRSIGFLYLDQSYMVYHSIGIAIELAKEPFYEVVIFTNPQNKTLIKEILSREKCENVILKVLRPYWHFTISIAKAEQKQLIFLRYRNLFAKIDAFLCCKQTDLDLKKILKHKVKYIYTDHGIPNRKVAFSEVITEFDLFFLCGKTQKLLKLKDGHLTDTNYSVTGYLKFDSLVHNHNTKLFTNNNYTFIYNPHWENHLTSFFTFGEKIFNFFANRKDYNLIFSPHYLLIQNNFFLKFRYNFRKFSEYENIKIDYRSEMCNNMTYTKYADFYIGEGSSQVWEFVAFKNRPCLFLDAHELATNKEERLLSWKLGDNISDFNDFDKKIEVAKQNFEEKYKNVQEKEVKEMFYKHPKYSASQLAAQAIIKLLEEK